MSNKKQHYIDNQTASIKAYITGMCIGANMLGIDGIQWEQKHAQRSLELIEKEIKKLVKYLTTNE